MLNTYNINRQAVLDEIKKTTAYTDAMHAALPEIPRVSIVDEDGEMLERYWRDACIQLTTACKKYLSSVQVPTADGLPDPEDTFSLTLNTPPSWDAQLSGAVSSHAFSYVVNSMLAQWYAQVGYKDAETQANIAEGILSNLKNILAVRKPPQKKDKI